MSYFSNTQEQFNSLIQSAQKHISIFCSPVDEGFWRRKIGGCFFKKSLIDHFQKFLNKKDVNLDIVYREDQAYGELFENIKPSYKATFIPLTDTEFIKPLDGLSESFIVVDSKKSFISSNYKSDSGILSLDNTPRALFLLSIFSQLMRHEFQIKYGRIPAHTILPLESIPQAQENINAIMYHHNSPIQTLRRHNPLVERIINTHQK